MDWSKTELLKEEIESGMSADDIQNDLDFLYGALPKCRPGVLRRTHDGNRLLQMEGVNALMRRRRS